MTDFFSGLQRLYLNWKDVEEAFCSNEYTPKQCWSRPTAFASPCNTHGKIHDFLSPISGLSPEIKVWQSAPKSDARTRPTIQGPIPTVLLKRKSRSGVV